MRNWHFLAQELEFTQNFYNIFLVSVQILRFWGFWRPPRSDSGGLAGDGNRILHQVFYPHFLKKMKMSLPTSAAKSLFHVFYLGVPPKLYTIHLGVPYEI